MTTIQWADITCNPIIGCSKVSPACRSCYAEAIAYSFSRRFANGPHRRYLQVLDGKRWNGKAYLDRDYLARTTVGRGLVQRVREPDGSWRPARVFCVSMGDMFHESLSVDEIAEVWQWMARGSSQRGPTWIVITKRPHRAVELLPEIVAKTRERLHHLAGLVPVVHLLTTVESQEYAPPRLDALVRCAPWVARLGVSAEPLLGPLDLRPWLDRLGWVIIGGESGKDARPLEVAWVLDLLDQCRATGVAPFVKQLGRRPVLGRGVQALTTGRKVWPGPTGEIGVDAPLVLDPKSTEVRAWLRDRAGGDPMEWPEALRVREWPAA